MPHKKVLIVGLGNVGHSYEYTRHNVGFHVIDELAHIFNCKLALKSSFHAYIGQHITDKGTYILVKPTCYMNNSGEVVKKLWDWYKISPDDECFIVTDNVDISVGSIKLKRPLQNKTSSTTHNGIRSTIKSLGHSSFTRVYLGIKSEEKNEHEPLSSYVLKRWKNSEDELYKTMFMVSATVLSHALTDDFEVLSQLLACLLGK